jgi:hypothetical protein
MGGGVRRSVRTADFAEGGIAMSENEVRFSGHPNTMIALTLVASTLSLALSMWTVSRVGDLEAFVAVQAITEAAKRAGD